MPAFPEFTYAPQVAGHDQAILSDPVHRAEFESGALLTRTRSTAVPRTRRLILAFLTEAEKQMLEDFEQNDIGYGGAEFTWQDPAPGDGRTWNAQLVSPISYNRHPQSTIHWQAEVTIALVSEV